MMPPPPQPKGPFKLSDEQKNRIIGELQKRGVIAPCSRCGQNNFGLADGLFTNLLGDGRTINLGGPALPTAVVVCTNCGAVYQHSVGVLGLFGELGIGS